MSQAQNGRLTIAVVRPYLTLAKGGAERHALELVRGLVGLGHAVHVFAYRWDQPREPGVTYHAVWMLRKPAWLRVLTFHWSLRRRLDLSAYDAVLGMTPFYPQTVFWLGDGLYAVWARVAWPHALVRRLMCLKRAVMTANLWFERKILSSPTTHFIANSKLVQRQAMALYGVPEERIAVVYPGIDTGRYYPGVRRQWRAAVRRRLGIGDRDVVLLFASNNFKRKGLDRLIRALSALSRPVRLLVVGSGRPARFRRLARRLAVADKIVFTGPADRMEEYYGACDALILPTRYDPCAAVCLEALACGLPVVTTDFNGAAEWIRHGIDGRVLACRTLEKDLADSLRELTDPACLSGMPVVSAERVRELSVENQVRRIAGVLADVAARRARGPSIRVSRPAPDLLINDDFSWLLERHGLWSFSALMEARGAREISYNRQKRIGRLVLEGDPPRVFFLKRHRVRSSWRERVKLWLDRSHEPDGLKEWANFLAFHRRGLPVATPVAAGKRALSGGVQESFLLTAGLEGYQPLDSYISETWRPSPARPTLAREKRRLLRAAAELARAMHESGFNHRDFYLCHVFVKPARDRGFDLRLIDLQRAGYRKARRRRWWVKDLAQLHYSSLGLPVSDRERLRFYAFYAAQRFDRKERRRILRRVAVKARSIARHDAAQVKRKRAVVPADHFELPSR